MWREWLALFFMILAMITTVLLGTLSLMLFLEP